MNRYLREYIFYESKFEDLKYNEEVCELDAESGKENITTTADMLWGNAEDPFVKVFISDTASQEDVKQFITKKWKAIQKQLDKQRTTPKPPRIRRKLNLKRNAKIKELYKMTHDKLGIKRGDYAKEKYIRDLIEAEFSTTLDFMTIRKIGSGKS